MYMYKSMDIGGEFYWFIFYYNVVYCISRFFFYFKLNYIIFLWLFSFEVRVE